MGDHHILPFLIKLKSDKGFMKNNIPLIVGKGKDMQFNPHIWEKWNSDACDKDQWKHGRISELYRIGYENIKWEGNNVHTR